jgi:hypothetical protein
MTPHPHRTHTTHSMNLPGSSPPSRSSRGAHEWPAAAQTVPPEFGKRENEAEKLPEGLAQ